MKLPPRRQRAPRAQTPSAFSPFLEALRQGCPGCRAVAFVDREGEAVDFIGSGSEFDIKVAAAHLRILLQEADVLPGTARRLVVGNERRSYVIEQLPEGYALVLVYPSRAAFTVSERALNACAHALGREAGFPNASRSSRPFWQPVEVKPRHPRRSRPEWALMGGSWQAVQVIGVHMNLAPRERGYRVRLAGGAEVTLVREPLGRWFVDDKLD